MAEKKSSTQSDRKWQSDIIADLIRQYGFPYITLNPGASYRGLHDSLVNHNGDKPPMLLCQHEKIAVQIAHGYAKACGEPLCVIVHNVVGLLHATMGVYYAYMDRAPVFIIGATGPMDEGKRRPRVDWEHTAIAQGTPVRDYVKWDYQPGGIQGVPDSFARAYSIMMTEPQGPIYMCYDAALQEAPLTRTGQASRSRRRPKCRARSRPTRPRLRRSRTCLSPPNGRCCCRNMSAASRSGIGDMVALAETTRRCRRSTCMSRLNFPTEHPLDCRLNKDVFKQADLITLARLPRLGRPDALQRPHQPHAEVALPRALPVGRYRLCRHRSLALGDGLSEIPRMRRARAGRHRARDSGAHQALRERIAEGREGLRSASPSASARSAKCTTPRPARSGARRRARIGTHRPSRCRASPRKYGSRSRTRTGSSPRRPSRTGR